MQFRQFHNLRRYLLKNVQLPFPFKVRRMKLTGGIDGDCTFMGTHFLIRIRDSMSEAVAMDVLIHEVAHCVSWDKEPNDHGPLWGKAYSCVYRKFLDWSLLPLN